MYADENMLYFKEDSGDGVVNCNGMGILNIDLKNFDEDDPDTIVLTRLLAWHIKFEKNKELEKIISEELIPIAWHSNR